MNILDDILNNLSTDSAVRSVTIGVHWTVVCSHHCGMAATMMENHTHGTSQVRDAGRLHTKSARELAEYARSDNQLEASIGVAAINSILEVQDSQAVEINAFDVLAQQGRGKNVAVVGRFPFIQKLRAEVGHLWVIEKKPVEDEFPAESAADLIPQAQVVAITSSSLINHTMDELLAYCSPDALVMALGPSTPLSPLLFNHGVNILSGSRVVDEAALLRTVTQGASFRQVEGVRLLTLKKDKPNLNGE